MTPETILQAAGRTGTEPATIRKWLSRGKIKPIAREGEGFTARVLLDPADVDTALIPRVRGKDRQPRRPRGLPPLQPVPFALGLAVLEAQGRYVPCLEGPRCIGRVLIGADWLKVYRSESGIVYHEQTEWMDSDPDWMENTDYAAVMVALEMAA